MTPLFRRCAACLVILAMLFLDVRPAKADELKNAVVGAVIAIVVVSVGVTVGIVLLVKKSPTVTGCAMDSPEGLELQTEDKQVYRLLGDTASIQPGERVHVKGKKRKDKGQIRSWSNTRRSYSAAARRRPLISIRNLSPE